MTKRWRKNLCFYGRGCMHVDKKYLGSDLVESYAIIVLLVLYMLFPMFSHSQLCVSMVLYVVLVSIETFNEQVVAFTYLQFHKNWMDMDSLTS